MSQKFFYNKIVTRNQAIVLSQKANNPEKLRDFVLNIILSEADYDPERKGIYLDYLLNAYKFCLQKFFSAEKVSTLLSIAKYIFNESIEKKLRFNESYELLKNLLNLHEIQREPYFMGIFSTTEKADILKFFTASFYKHYTLYDVAMTKTINYKVSLVDMLAATLPKPLSLSEGIEINPERVAELGEWIPKQIEAEQYTVEDEMKEGQENAQQNVGEEQREEKKEPQTKIFLKTEEDLKLEEALEKTLKVFYNKLDAECQEKSEQMATKIEARSAKPSAKKK